MPVGLSADEADDRAAIRRVIADVNRYPLRAELFTDEDAARDVGRVWRSRAPVRFRVRPGLGRPTVVISHEPWGEARIEWPAPVIEVIGSRMFTREIRFLDDDVAMVDVELTEGESAETARSTPLLILMRRTEVGWRVAAARVLAAP